MVYYVVIGEHDQFVDYTGNAIGIIKQNFLPKDKNENHEAFTDPFCFFIGYQFKPQDLGIEEPYPEEVKVNYNGQNFIVRKRFGECGDNKQFLNKKNRDGVAFNQITGEKFIPKQVEVLNKKTYSLYPSSIQRLKQTGALK